MDQRNPWETKKSKNKNLRDCAMANPGLNSQLNEKVQAKAIVSTDDIPDLKTLYPLLSGLSSLSPIAGCESTLAHWWVD